MDGEVRAGADVTPLGHDGSRRFPRLLLPYEENVVDLEALGRVLMAAHEEGLPACLFRVIDGPGDEFELGLLRVGDLHPIEVLQGFVAPDDWSALGVVAGAWATTPAGRERARVAVVVDREGAASGVVALASGRTITEAPSEGRLLDGLRSALGVVPQAGRVSGC
jgi:hypothetical protein